MRAENDASVSLTEARDTRTYAMRDFLGYGQNYCSQRGIIYYQLTSLNEIGTGHPD